MKTQSKDLSKRERDEVELLLQGKSNKQIAFALGIAESTVGFHLKNIYAKLQVSSRAEAILKLGETTVESESRSDHTGGMFILWKQWVLFVKETVSMIKKEIEMKNRFFSYFFGGLIFGGLFFFYLEVVGRFMNRLSINEEYPFEIWAFISLELILIFGVWLIPTIYPARREFLHSKKISLSARAVIIMWVSAVLGYYLIYMVLLAFVGLPNMEYYLLFGQRGPTFWQDWAELFPRLIMFKFLQWAIVSIIVGGLAGLLTSSMYSIWIKSGNAIVLD